jgi:hypothetical protein
MMSAFCFEAAAAARACNNEGSNPSPGAPTYSDRAVPNPEDYIMSAEKVASFFFSRSAHDGKYYVEWQTQRQHQRKKKKKNCNFPSKKRGKKIKGSRYQVEGQCIYVTDRVNLNRNEINPECCVG